MRGGHDIDAQLSTAATAMAQPRLRPGRDGSGGACAAEAKPAPPTDPGHSTPLPTGASKRASDINHGFTPDAKRSLELALRVAIELHHKRIEPGYLLLGLVRLDDEFVSGTVERSGTSVAALSTAVLARLSTA